ncbi:hypothetical protein [Paracraurococcus lichenis]|uniref:Uncharacterized protein n=1 Tax=Paracraurococcus lichenis TaxID=3064888 RepID=A0ABT9EC40_9PROT|nr:hypothetical protein [Paracraurococcus sp. LOR1-02]MDO9713784.1 hypothetical protein [Paracraurococcus sp. LOR1-02]
MATAPSQAKVDEIGGGDFFATPPGSTNMPPPPADPDDLDLVRQWLLDRHRTEWASARGAIYRLLQRAQTTDGAPMSLSDRLKVARVVPRALEIIQEGERRAWGLDADLIDYDALTDAQLAALARGRRPQ